MVSSDGVFAAFFDGEELMSVPSCDKIFNYANVDESTENIFVLITSDKVRDGNGISGNYLLLTLSTPIINQT